MAVDMRHEQGVAICRLLGDKVGGDHTSSACLVVNDDGDVPHGLKFLGQHTGQRVGTTSRREPHHNANGARGQSLSFDHGRGQQSC